VIEEDQGGEVIRYTYDECGSLIRLTYPTGETITYERDADLRLSCLTDWLGRRYEIAYADDDRGWTLTAPSGLITVTRQSAVGLTTSIIVQRAKDASVLFQSKLTYDHEDRVSRFHDSRFGLRRYVYDSEGQLLAAEKPATPYQNETFAYDRAGNRTRCNDESATVNSLNQLVTQGTVQCAYDDRGSMTARSGAGGGWKYTYNSRNQMIGAEGEHGQSISYGYDAFGRRIWKKQVIDASNSSLTRYVWAGEQIVREVTVHTIMTGNPGANGKTLRKHSRDYLYWLQSYIPLLMRAGGEVYQYHTDHLGTPRRLTDERGGVVWEADYVAYGEARITVNTVAQPWRFPGQYEDAETGLHYNRFRYYDPVLGKYLTRDPVSFLSGLNLYCYCHNNPVNEADPLGLWPSWVKKVVPVVAAVAVAAVVVATAPVSVPIMATVFAAGVAAGAAFGALSEGFENGFSCLSCVGGAALKGGVIGGLAALPFAFLPAAAGYAAFMGVGALSGGIGYVADWWYSGADPDNWSWIEFAGTVGLSAVTAGAGRYLGRRLGNRWRVPTTERIFRSARVRRAMREAWDDSLPDDPTFRHEEGGYIVRRRNGRLDVERWPRGNTDIISAPLIDDKGRYKGQLVVGRFHTHPHPAIDQYDRKYVQGPSQEDIDISKSKGYSHSYVIGRNEIWRIDNTGNVENIGKRAKWLSP
jgi:RHS repeat-associated protein